MLTPAIRAICALALPLLVSRIRADHQDRAVAADDLALFAHRLYGSSDLHRSGFVSTTGLPHAPGIGRQAQLTGHLGRPGKIAGGMLRGGAGEGGRVGPRRNWAPRLRRGAIRRAAAPRLSSL